jgi:type II secretory pathway pseudopilin PulG
MARLSRLCKARRSRGVSLLEALIFVAVVGLVAVVALPNFTSSSAGQVELAASEIAEALRFARAESMRTGDVFGVTVDKDTERLIVFKVKMNPLPVAPEFTIYHPIRKQLWDVSFGSNLSTRSVDVANASGPFEYVGLAAQPTVLFNARGRPFGVDTASGQTYRLANSTAVSLTSAGNDAALLRLDPMNGRVVVN